MKEKNNAKKATNKKEKRNMIIGIAMMVFAVAISVGTYAYYQTTLSGTVSGTILAWDCSGGNITTSSISLTGLKPGSTGTITFNVKSANFKTDQAIYLKYSRALPANFKMYAGTATSGTALSIPTGTTWSGTETKLLGENGVAANTAKSYTVTYNWPYAGSDTPLSTTSDVPFTFYYKIVCTQVQN